MSKNEEEKGTEPNGRRGRVEHPGGAPSGARDDSDEVDPNKEEKPSESRSLSEEGPGTRPPDETELQGEEGAGSSVETEEKPGKDEINVNAENYSDEGPSGVVTRLKEEKSQVSLSSEDASEVEFVGQRLQDDGTEKKHSLQQMNSTVNLQGRSREEGIKAQLKSIQIIKEVQKTRKNVQRKPGLGEHGYIPVKRKWHTFLFEKETGKIFRKTPKKWGLTCGYFLLFYTGLFTLSMIWWSFFQLTLSPGIPKRLAGDSIMNKVPGVTIFPSKMAYMKNSTSSIVCHISRFIADYNWTPIEPCTPENKFNYETSSPCVFLKLNKMYGWEPKGDIRVDCHPRRKEDKGRVGLVRYIPEKLETSSFPFLNQKGFKSPLMALVIQDLKPDVEVSVECTVIGSDFHNQISLENRGAARVSLFIEVKTVPSPAWPFFGVSSGSVKHLDT